MLRMREFLFYALHVVHRYAESDTSGTHSAACGTTSHATVVKCSKAGLPQVLINALWLRTAVPSSTITAIRQERPRRYSLLASVLGILLGPARFARRGERRVARAVARHARRVVYSQQRGTGVYNVPPGRNTISNQHRYVTIGQMEG